MTHDRIEREILIDAAPETVWAVITEPEHIAGWFGDKAELDVRVGGQGLFTFTDHGVSSAVRIERLDPPTAFSYRWGQGADNALTPATSTLVEFTLVPTGPQTRLRVVETGFAGLAVPVAEQVKKSEGNVGGWRAELADLQAYVAEGVAIA